jgi:predicted outer membrane repeat protein
MGAAQGDLDLEGDTIVEGAGMDLTVLDGEGIGDHFFPVMDVAEIRDLTLTGAESMDFGGAIEVDFGSSAVLERIAVLGNSSALSGGGIAAAGDLTVRECFIADNGAQISGGGIVAGLDAEVTIENSYIEGNAAAFGRGAGVAALDSSIVIVDQTRIRGNRTGLFVVPLSSKGGLITEGGGVYVGQNAGVALTDSLVAGNASAVGAGLRVEGQAVVVSSTIAWNRGLSGAGISVIGDGVLTLSNSTVSGNGNPVQAAESVLVEGASAYLTASTIRPRGTGEAVRGIGATLILEDSAFDGRCTFGGGATATSIGGNVALVLACWTASDPTLGDDVVADLLLSDLASFGGPTPTHLPLPGSPLLDHALGACPDVDQRGEPRSVCDSGSVERQADDPVPIFVDGFESGSVEAWSSSVGFSD